LAVALLGVAVTEGSMPYEYPAQAGTVRLVMRKRYWVFEFSGKHCGRWRTADEAAASVARHRTGSAKWDREPEEVPDDLLDWRPLGESI
jgi:hypothetical protein